MSVSERVPTGSPENTADFHRGFSGLEQEHAGWVEDVRGRIPADLTGTFFRNGPGRMEMGGRQYGHWFDGPGMISAVTFLDGRAHFRNRYVRTRQYVDESKSHMIVYRGFGTQLEGGLPANFMRPLSYPANTKLYLNANQ